MDVNLLTYDMEKFLDKYTRFMTKNIYITTRMLNRFLEPYCYLYDILERDRYLYSDNKKFQKVMNIKENSKKLLKLHNQKYLKGVVAEYQDFFDDLKRGLRLDSRMQHIICSDEEDMLVIEEKNKESLVIGKVAYLLEKKKYSADKILVLVEDENNYDKLFKMMLEQDFMVSIQSLSSYGPTFLKDGETLLSKSLKYDILFQYLTKVLFPNKELFNSFYKCFSNYLYLNKDYKDYETFKDYHNYMFKRKYLTSKLSLKEFNMQEVKKRRMHLRSILNESIKSKDEVDIANFLYLNSISYQYDYNTSVFQIQLNGKVNQIVYLDYEEPALIEDESTSLDNDIYLYSSYSKKSCLQVLAYELIKRRYPLEYITEEVLYDKLKDTTVENYFSEFLLKHLIPILDYYDSNHSFDKTKLTKEQKQQLEAIYDYYQSYLVEYQLVREDILFDRMNSHLENYQYLIIVGDIPIECKCNIFKIISDYPEVDLLKENIKLLYDYKQYLYERQSLSILHVYQNIEELNTLTALFIKDNLKFINKELEQNKKEIEVYLYDDKNRLHIYRNINSICYDILNKDSLCASIVLTHLNDMNLLLIDGLFSKDNKNTLITDSGKRVDCQDLYAISNHPDHILMPFLIKDPYHLDLLRVNEDYYMKVRLYLALNKCREKVVLLCPLSRKKDLKKILGSLDNKIIN